MTSFFDAQAAQEEMASLYGDTLRFDPESEPGWTDKARAAMGAMAGILHREGASYSKANNFRKASQGRNEQIDALVKSGVLDEGFVDRHRDMSELTHVPFPDQMREHAPLDYGSMAEELSQQGYDVQTDAEINDFLSDSLRYQRWQDEETLAEADGVAGFAGAAIGAMGVGLADPVNLASMFIPVAGVKQRATMAGTFVRTGMSVAAANVAAETIIQHAFVMPYKEEINSPYSPGDALMSVGVAATAGFLLGGTAGAAQYFLRRFDDPTAANAQIDEIIDGLPEDSPARKDMEQFRDQQNQYVPPQGTEVTPERMADVTARYEALPNKDLEVGDELGLNVTTVKARADEARNTTELFEKMEQCLFGAATDG